MKSGFLAAAILFCALLPASAAHSEVLPGSYSGATFTRVSVPEEQPGLGQPGRVVLRQRIVGLHVEKLLSQPDLDSISMDLFNNFHLTALRSDEQNDNNGFLLWTGKVEGVQGGKAVLVIRDGILFASIYLPSSIIQIRPATVRAGDDSQGYIIRELAYPWRGGSVQDTVSTDCGSAAGLNAYATRMVELVNLERVADGLPALEYNGELSEAARRHATDMARHDICSHELSDGEKFYQNVFDSGYPVTEVGENVAAGISTPEEAFECLLSSPEHRSNIMSTDFRQIGVSDAVNATSGYRYFWAQEFGAGSTRSGRAIRLSAN